MSEFTASNGIGVEINEDEQIIFEVPNRPTSPIWVTNGEIDALREYIIAEEDKRLGRWRWPENPDYLVKRSDFDPSYLYVLTESTFEVYGLNGITDDSEHLAEFRAAAQAFRDAHPEPKPWHDAKPGDVWALTVDGEESAFYPSKSLDRAFTPVKPESGRTAVAFDSFEITAGRRIWPDGDAS